MATMNVSLEDDLKAFATSERVKARGFSSASEYIRHLVRVDRELDRLRGLIEEGLESGPPEPLSTEAFDELRRRARTG
ncbi:MAG: ribbon-helix-helix domain-containing protein [Longimicrobiales bacterium]